MCMCSACEGETESECVYSVASQLYGNWCVYSWCVVVYASLWVVSTCWCRDQLQPGLLYELKCLPTLQYGQLPAQAAAISPTTGCRDGGAIS